MFSLVRIKNYLYQVKGVDIDVVGTVVMRSVNVVKEK